MFFGNHIIFGIELHVISYRIMNFSLNCSFLLLLHLLPPLPPLISFSRSLYNTRMAILPNWFWPCHSKLKRPIKSATLKKIEKREKDWILLRNRVDYSAEITFIKIEICWKYVENIINTKILKTRNTFTIMVPFDPLYTNFYTWKNELKENLYVC